MANTGSVHGIIVDMVLLIQCPGAMKSRCYRGLCFERGREPSSGKLVYLQVIHKSVVMVKHLQGNVCIAHNPWGVNL